MINSSMKKITLTEAKTMKDQIFYEWIVEEMDGEDIADTSA